MAEATEEKKAEVTTTKKTYYLSGKDDGQINMFQELLAMITLGTIMAWYYIFVISTVFFVVLAFFASHRTFALTCLVIEFSSVFLPLHYQVRPAFCNSWIFTLWRRYFYYEWVMEEAIDPKKRYLFAEMPHGIFPWAEFLSISKTVELFPGTTVDSIAASVVFRMPGLRHIFSWIGCRPASPANIAAIYNEGASCAITVGGLAEMFLVGGDKERLYLKKHKGFVREAMKNGADLVPVFAFGNSKLLYVLGQDSRTSMGLLKKLSRKLQASILIFYGRFLLPIPLRLPLKFVIGKPIKVQHNSSPSPEEIQKLHDLFCEKISELYYEHRPEWEDRELLIL